MDLTNSKRLIFTGSYVTTNLTKAEQKKESSTPSRGIQKANILRSMGLDKQQLDTLLTQIDVQEHSIITGQERESIVKAARQMAMEPSVLNTEIAEILASVPHSSIIQFAKEASKKDIAKISPILINLMEQQQKVSPVGWLHLERIEMYPVGDEKGELVYTVPMAPNETIAISHKEWSRSSREYEEIIEDYFESYSEKGVAENTDVSMSTESESQRESAFNFGASLSGGYAGVTLTTTVGLSNSVKESQSAKSTMQRSREVTEKASARSRKDHKVSFKIEDQKGTEDSSFRKIVNKQDFPVRIDYYRMMRKWRTDLYRYGLRLTYDISIPTPGVRLWAYHERILEIERLLQTPFAFGLKTEWINETNYRDLANKVQTVVEPPPMEYLETIVYGHIDYLNGHEAAITRFGNIDFEVPPGYAVHEAEFIADMAVWPDEQVVFRVLNAEPNPPSVPNKGIPKVKSALPEYKDREGRLSVTYVYCYISTASITIKLKYKRTGAAWKAWQRSAHQAIRSAAETRNQEKMARLQEERDRLWRQLNGKDTLSLRRLEREELLRQVMQWILGPSNLLATTKDVEKSLSQIETNEREYQQNVNTDLAPTMKGITKEEAVKVLAFGDLVKFIHQAIEWENLLYFLYPYFWGSEQTGRDKFLFEHPDSEHQRFLRAGYARMVLPVRPGFEKDFTHLVETGTLSSQLTSSYMTVAQDIENFARTNYAGIPPANPEKHARPLLHPEQRATWETMQQVMVALEEYKRTHNEYPPDLNKLPGGAPIDAWGNFFQYRTPGLGGSFDLLSTGADGQLGGDGLDADISSAAGASLIGTWFDYTPTSALDIEMHANPEKSD